MWPSDSSPQRLTRYGDKENSRFSFEVRMPVNKAQKAPENLLRK
jgi:hypothetical protein